MSGQAIVISVTVLGIALATGLLYLVAGRRSTPSNTAFVRGDASGSTFVGNRSDADRFIDGPARGTVFRNNRLAGPAGAEQEMGGPGRAVELRDLVAFVRQQITDDDRLADIAADSYGSGGHWARSQWAPDTNPTVRTTGGKLIAVAPALAEDATAAAHIARWDPWRIRRDCAARTETLDLVLGLAAKVDTAVGCRCSAKVIEAGECGSGVPPRWWRRLTRVFFSGKRRAGAGAEAAWPVVRSLARPYADRPGVHDEWCLADDAESQEAKR